jgi:hypothetical protein
MLDNDYIHTFSTMSSLKSSKQNLFPKLRIRHQKKTHSTVLLMKMKKHISPMLRKPSKINAFDITQR